jgi:SAM-dependent methyltransferase
MFLSYRVAAIRKKRQGADLTDKAVLTQSGEAIAFMPPLETVACNLCEGRRSEQVLRQRDLLHGVSPDEFAVVRCLDCGLLYLNPRPTPAEISRYYPEQYFVQASPKTRTEVERVAKRFSGRITRWIGEDYYGYPSPTHHGVWRSIRKALLWPEKLRRVFCGRHIMPWVGQGRVLDVGCGTGGNLVTLQQQGWDVHGIEMSGTAVALARERVGDRIHHGTLETAPYADESFDVIFMSHSLEHMFSPVATLERLRGLLRPAGMLVIAVPNVGSLEAKLFGKWWVPWDPPRHLYHFEKETLRKVLERAKFKVSQMRTAVGTMFFMVSLERAWIQSGRKATLPARRLIEKLIAKPFCLVAGHLGYGTELTVHAVKKG